VLDRRPLSIAGDAVREVLGRFVGRIEQTPPRYSAVKVRGQAMYKWARKGIEVEAPPRQVEVFSLSVDEISLPYVQFRLSCSGGTYVRSLCADAGEILGCGACLAGLRRTRSGAFSETAALALGKEDGPEERERLRAGIIPLAAALPELPAVAVNDSWRQRVRDGVQPRVEMVNDRDDIPFLAPGDMVKLIDGKGDLAAIARMMCGSGDFRVLAENAPVMSLVRVFHEN